MINIPLTATLLILLVSVNSFRVLPRDDNPDLLIDEDQNLVEPKVNYWNVFLKTKAKTSFKNVVKFLNSIDARDKYSVAENEAAVDNANQPHSLRSEFREIKESDTDKKDNTKKMDDSLIIQDPGNKEMPDSGIISGGADFGKVYFDSVSDDESKDGSEYSNAEVRLPAPRTENSDTEESLPRNATISKTDKSDSKESSDSSVSKGNVKVTDNSDSKESASSEEQDDLIVKAEQPAGPRYAPRLPKSLHQYAMRQNRRYVHSFRDGWLF